MTNPDIEKNPSFFTLLLRKGGQKHRVMAATIILAVLLPLFVWLSTQHWADKPDAATGVVSLNSTAQNGTAAQGDIPLEAKTPHVFKGEINPGDTASTILQDWIPGDDIQSMVESCKNIYPLSRLRAGNPYVVIADAEGLHSFEYEIDSDQKLVIKRGQGGYEACLEAIAYDFRLELVKIRIDSNLFQAVADAGEGPNLAVSLADIFGWEVDFIKNLREGDTFLVLVEKRYQNGEFKRYGPILGARFVNQGKEYEAFYYKDAYGGQFFTQKGDSLKRAFLKAPLSFTRISSGYNLRRKHPIFKEVRPHPAIDYAAPTGTPVKAIGRGTVTYAGWGRGAGKHIILRHSNGYESIYMHLSGFAKGVKNGAKVEQGKVIGYVGSTGYSTGPHLDFRIKYKGNYINPAKVTSPRSEPVSKQNMADFKAKVELAQAFMNGEKPLSDYSFDANGASGEKNAAGNAPQGNATRSAGLGNATAAAPEGPQNGKDKSQNDSEESFSAASGPAEH